MLIVNVQLVENWCRYEQESAALHLKIVNTLADILLTLLFRIDESALGPLSLPEKAHLILTAGIQKFQLTLQVS
jgi:hypothetical protein